MVILSKKELKGVDERSFGMVAETAFFIPSLYQVFYPFVYSYNNPDRECPDEKQDYGKRVKLIFHSTTLGEVSCNGSV